MTDPHALRLDPVHPLVESIHLAIHPDAWRLADQRGTHHPSFGAIRRELSAEARGTLAPLNPAADER